MKELLDEQSKEPLSCQKRGCVNSGVGQVWRSRFWLTSSLTGDQGWSIEAEEGPMQQESGERECSALVQRQYSCDSTYWFREQYSGMTVWI